MLFNTAHFWNWTKEETLNASAAEVEQFYKHAIRIQEAEAEAIQKGR